MAAELVAGALLSSFLSVWFDRLASREVKDFIRGQKTTQGLLKKLEIKLLPVNKVLDDAEEKQIRDPTVRKWGLTSSKMIDLEVAARVVWYPSSFTPLGLINLKEVWNQG